MCYWVALLLYAPLSANLLFSSLNLPPLTYPARAVNFKIGRLEFPDILTPYRVYKLSPRRKLVKTLNGDFFRPQ